MKTLNFRKAILILLSAILVVSCEKNQPPKCWFIEPLDGTTVTKGELVSISINAEDEEGEVSEVRLYINESGLISLDFPYKYELNTGEYQSGLYTMKAVALDNEGLESYDEVNFTIDATYSTVTTTEVTSVTYNSALAGGSVTDDGGGEITETGIYWDTTSSPETAGNQVPMGSGIGEFSGTISELPHGTQIYYKAYAVNSAGVSFGEELSFTTNTVPTVNTKSAHSVDHASAVISGEVTSDGGESLTETGFYWSTEPMAETTGTRLPVERVDGIFSTKLEDLSLITTYYIRAFAVNAVGESLGEEVSFTTNGPTTVNTLPVESIKYKSAVVSGVVTDDGGSEVTETGFYWGTSPDPVNTGVKLSVGSGLGNFTIKLVDLIPGSAYYYRAYAVTTGGVSVGDESTFELFEVETGTLNDPRDDIVYGTVKIGEQVWMSENLKATQYSDGTDIPLVADDVAWADNSGPAYCWYDDDPQSEDRGALYNWYTVETRKLCPSGWIVPSDQEWMQLEIYLGMDENTANLGNFRGTNEGGMLKSTTLWLAPNEGATNEILFSALPTGRRGYQGEFFGQNEYTYFWASDAAPGAEPFRRHLSTNRGTISRTAAYKNSGFAIRCVKDE